MELIEKAKEIIKLLSTDLSDSKYFNQSKGYVIAILNLHFNLLRMIILIFILLSFFNCLKYLIYDIYFNVFCIKFNYTMNYFMPNSTKCNGTKFRELNFIRR